MIPRFLGFSRRPGRPTVPLMNTAQHSTAGVGRELVAPDAVLTVKVDAAHTDDAYELFEVDAPRGPATPLHSTDGARRTTSCTAG